MEFPSRAVIKDLGVTLDSDLVFDAHIKNISRVAFYHLRNISKIRKMLSLHNAEKLINAFVTSRLDYCKALLSGCANSTLKGLQLIQNAAACILTRAHQPSVRFTSLVASYILNRLYDITTYL